MPQCDTRMVSVDDLHELIGEYTVSSLTRRSLLQMSAGIAATGVVPSSAAAADGQIGWQPRVQPARQPIDKPQRLFIKNRRTGDVFNDVVRQGPLVYQDAYSQLDHLMRDWRRDEVISMDPKLIDLLLAIQSEVGHEQPITVISAYRSKTTNDMLRRKIRKVAKNSYHIKGMAVDLRIKGISTGALRQIAMHQRVGGVGYYPRQEFIHLDTGPIRSWRS